jgi:hypothetical protein
VRGGSAPSVLQEQYNSGGGLAASPWGKAGPQIMQPAPPPPPAPRHSSQPPPRGTHLVRHSSMHQACPRTTHRRIMLRAYDAACS